MAIQYDMEKETDKGIEIFVIIVAIIVIVITIIYITTGIISIYLFHAMFLF